MSRAALLLSPALLLLLVAPLAATPRTPNELLALGPPVFVAGTKGDDRCDAEVRAQIELIRGMLFPGSPVVADDAVELAKGPEGWPDRPVLYGGPAVNTVVAALAPRLPFALGEGKLAIGGRTFEGPEYRIIALVPPLPAAEGAPATPAFLLYAGTGVPGVAEINAVSHGGDGFLVADRFGPRVAGTFEAGADGRPVARLGPERPRIAWRETVRGAAPEGAVVRVRRPAMLPAKAEEAGVDDRLFAAASRIREGLRLRARLELEVYVYPDRRSKASLTGNGGDGHADALSGTLHVIAGPPAALEDLVTHEGTHVAAFRMFGLAGTPALAEGLAVAVAGGYGGVPLDRWPTRLPERLPTLEDLLGRAFRRLPEPVSYPVAGLLVRALLDRLGPEAFGKAVYPASAEGFPGACAAAGLPAEDLATLYRLAIGR